MSLQTLYLDGDEIENRAVQQAINHSIPYAGLKLITRDKARLNKQLVGKEILREAIKQALSSFSINPKEGVYLSIENGIDFLEEINGWVDYSICLAYLPPKNQITWVRSQSIIFPTEAVEATKLKEGGFTINKVENTLQEIGLVKNHSDPHIDLVGYSRQETLYQALLDLLYKIIKGDKQVYRG